VSSQAYSLLQEFKALQPSRSNVKYYQEGLLPERTAQIVQQFLHRRVSEPRRCWLPSVECRPCWCVPAIPYKQKRCIRNDMLNPTQVRHLTVFHRGSVRLLSPSVLTCSSHSWVVPPQIRRAQPHRIDLSWDFEGELPHRWSHHEPHWRRGHPSCTSGTLHHWANLEGTSHIHFVSWIIIDAKF